MSPPPHLPPIPEKRRDFRGTLLSQPRPGADKKSQRRQYLSNCEGAAATPLTSHWHPSTSVTPSQIREEAGTRLRVPAPLRTTRKKLIEVALPLDAINSSIEAGEKLHTARASQHPAPVVGAALAAARSVIFARWWTIPSANPDLFPNERAQERERQRLFRIIEDLVKWENTTNEAFSSGRAPRSGSPGAAPALRTPIIRAPKAIRSRLPRPVRRRRLTATGSPAAWIGGSRI